MTAAWRESVEHFARLGELAAATLDPQSPQLVAEGNHVAVQSIFGNYPAAFHLDPRHPQWVSNLNILIPSAATNPDTVYSLARVSGDGCYRISGHRGTVRFADFQPGLVRSASDGPRPALPPVNIDDLTIGVDGTFSFIWSARRPEGYEGDWRPLDPAVGQIMVRQVAYDWVNEVDARFAIERLDVTDSKPRLNPDGIRERMGHLLTLSEVRARLFLGWIADLRQQGVVNRLALNKYAATGGIAGQDYYEGLYDLAVDEALIVENRIPAGCFYWSIHLWDHFFLSIDYVHRQSSLNGHTAFVHSDGRVQIVLSARDPGVRNWLDIRDFPQGGAMWRWMRCPDGGAPLVRVVKLSELSAALLPGTPAFTPEQRVAQRRARAIGAQLRRKW